MLKLEAFYQTYRTEGFAKWQVEISSISFANRQNIMYILYLVINITFMHILEFSGNLIPLVGNLRIF